MRRALEVGKENNTTVLSGNDEFSFPMKFSDKRDAFDVTAVIPTAVPLRQAVPRGNAPV